MPKLIKRSKEYVSGYREYCRELFDNNVIYFRPTDPKLIDDEWFGRTKEWYDKKEHGMSKVLLNINDKNVVSAHVCEKLGGELMDKIQAYNNSEGHHIMRRYWIYL